MKYFSYDYEDGIEYHETEAEARRRAEDALERERDYADEGWEEDTSMISYGKVIARCKEVPHEWETDTGTVKGVDYPLTEIED